jgi:Fe-S cluster assembly ATP-binding protein
LLVPMREFRRELLQKMKDLGIDQTFARRYVNEGFSGGEKKRVEVLQLAMLEPKIAIMDETDSGLDIDALRTVAEGINSFAGPQLGVLLITHYQRLLNYIKPHFVHILLEGQIVESGGSELAEQLEAKGYEWVREKYAVPAA